jgi:hypothetical protein
LLSNLLSYHSRESRASFIDQTVIPHEPIIHQRGTNSNAPFIGRSLLRQ